jgi:hypothetical protein
MPLLHAFAFGIAPTPESTFISSGLTPTSSAGTVSGALSDLSDGDYTDDWRANVDPATNVSNDWVRYDFTTTKTVTSARISPRNSPTNGNYKIQYSDNDSAWSNSGTTFSGQTATKPSYNTLDITGDAPGAHRYWRVVNISNSTGTSGWGYSEVELWGY